MTGKLTRNEKGGYVITMNSDSYSPFELLLLGGSIDDKEERLGTRVAVELYLPREKKKAGPPPAFLQKFANLPVNTMVDSLKLLKEEKCQDRARFVANKP